MTIARIRLAAGSILLSASFAFPACSPEPANQAANSALPVAQAAGPDLGAIAGKSKIVDLTVLVSETLPAHWGAYPPFQRWTYNWFAEQKNGYGTVELPSDGPYYGQRYIIDEHTGTQTDFPAHFVPPPGSGLPHAGPMGTVTGDKYPLDRMMGPAAVIDVTAIRDNAAPGMSARITVAMVKEWEMKHGAIQAGDVVLFYSGYTNAYYKPMPEGQRLTFQPIITKTAPGWPAPEPEVMDYLREKGVWHLGTDGASMGYADGGQPTHLAGLSKGMSWEEMLINLDQLPPRGAYYVALPLKIVDQSGSPTRAIAFVPGG
jgi:kynurenine formamidase